MIAGATLVGLSLFWQGIPLALLILLLLVAAYFTVALLSAALVLAFRTSGPLITAVLTLSSLLGGVYYSTAVIPSWLQGFSTLVPLTYGLRSIRRVLLTGATLGDVWGDVFTLAVSAVLLLAAGAAAFAMALRHSRSRGTLAQY
jgi:ABC-2 type transport system permease protein